MFAKCCMLTVYSCVVCVNVRVLRVLAGNPFAFMVNDPNRVTARGDGLSLLQCGQQASFTINAPGAQLRDLDIRVTGSSLCLSVFSLSLCLSVYLCSSYAVVLPLVKDDFY